MSNAGSRKPLLVALTGAGVSAESGLKTFRGDGGLWEGHRVEDVATPEAWLADPELVLTFYNERRAQVASAAPNPAHSALVALESHFDVHIITQNIDDLHERAGSSSVLHLHGEITKARSTSNPETLVTLPPGAPIYLGDLCPSGSQLRPHVVWFGESVPALPVAAEIVSTADILLVVGTSLAVYPAASLAFLSPPNCRRYSINPEVPDSIPEGSWECLTEKAASALPHLANKLIELACNPRS